MITREVLVRDFVAELRVIDLVIVPTDALLGHPGGAAGFKDIERGASQRRRHPHFRLEVAQPLILEMRELLQIGDALDFLARVEVLLRPVQPEGAPGFGAEVPGNHLAQVSLELLVGFLDGFFGNGGDHGFERHVLRVTTAMSGAAGAII
jgi:hypothetical protein